MTPSNEYIKEFEKNFPELMEDEIKPFRIAIIMMLEQKDKELREKIEDMDWLEFRAKHKDTDQRTFLLTISEVLKRV